MRARTNLLLFVVAVLLTTYVSFFERGPPIFTRRGKMFKDLEPADIVEVEISRPNATKDAGLGVDVRPIKVRREGSPPEWWIVEPIHYEAYHPKMQAIAYDIADLARVADVPQEASAGLRGGVEVVVKLKTRRGEEHTIEVGPDHPDPKLELSYATVDGQRIVTRRDFRKNVLVSLNEMRTRALLGIAPPDAANLAVSGELRFEKVFEREGVSERWRLKKPVDAMADREIVESFLKDLNAWAVSSFVSDDAQSKDLAAFGLDSPRAAVTLRHHDGRELTLEVGKDVDPAPLEPQVYVRHRGKPFVFAAPAEPLKKVFEASESFRTRYVFDLGIEDVDDLEGELEGSRVVLRREKQPDGKAFVWQVLDAAGKPAFPGDKSEIENVLVALRKLLIQKFLPAELAPPSGGLSLRTSSGRNLEMRIGAQSDAPEDRGHNMYLVSIPGEPGSYLVSTLLPSKLRTGPVAFRKKDICDLDPARVLEIEVVDGEKSWMLARTGPGDPWMLDADIPQAQGKELSSKVVNQFLLTLHKDAFRVETFLPELTDFAAHGLELERPRKAVIVHRLDGTESPAFRKLVIGDAVDGSNPVAVRARTDAAGVPPFTLEEDVLQRFEALAGHLREVTGE